MISSTNREVGLSSQDVIPITMGEPISPFQISKGIFAFRQMPGESKARYAGVREDAITLQQKLGHSFRDLLHTSFTLFGQGKGLPNVLEGIRTFYETGRAGNLEQAVRQPGTAEFFRSDHVALLLRREVYDEEVVDDRGNSHTVIDLIGKVEDYCTYARDLSEVSPAISDKKISDLMQPLRGGNRLDMGLVGEVLAGFNERVQELIGSETGVRLELVKALEWVDLKAGSAAFHLSYEDQVGGYTSEWFKSMMMFRELTGSPEDFNLEAFNKRIGNLKFLRGTNEKYDFVRSWTEGRLVSLKKSLEPYQDKDNPVMTLGLIDQSIYLTVTERKAATVRGEADRRYYAGIRFRTGYSHPGD